MGVQVVRKHVSFPTTKDGLECEKSEAGIAVQKLLQYFKFENLVVVAIKWNRRDVKEAAIRFGNWVDKRASEGERT